MRIFLETQLMLALEGYNFNRNLLKTFLNTWLSEHQLTILLTDAFNFLKNYVTSLFMKDYRLLLKNELERRRKVNPSYSLRAFSRDLEMAPAQLSTVLKGTKGLSEKSAQRIGALLGLSDDENQMFQHSVEALHSRSQMRRKDSKILLEKLLKEKKFSTLKEDEYIILNEWYYLSLLQTFDLYDFEPKADWIARKIGISETEVTQALSILEKAKLLKKEKFFYTPSKEFIRSADIPSRTIRFHLQKMMTKASRALETQTIRERDFSSSVFSLDVKRIPEFKKRIQKFREDFCKEASRSKTKDQVYNLSIQFFKITK